jgi:hypothetical protein
MSYVWNGPFWATDHVQGICGVVLAISSYLKKFVTALGSELRNCVWITMLFQERLLDFFSMYTPNLIFTRMFICTWMETSHLDVKWIIGGDFVR